MGMAGRRRRTSAPPVRALRVLRHDLTTERHEPDEPRGWMTYYGRFTPAALQPLLKRINGYLVRWARKKYRRLAPFKRAKRWWDDLLARNRPMFAHWQWTGTFQWL